MLDTCLTILAALSIPGFIVMLLPLGNACRTPRQPK